MASSAFSNSSWSNYVEVTSDNTKVSNANDNLLVDLGAQMPAGFWSKVKSDGGDIRITNSAGDTAYSFELENFDTTAKTGIVFFDSSLLATASDTTWRIYYGNSGASLPADTDTLGAHNVWNSNYKAVYHLQEDPSGTAPQIKDSTANGNDGTSAGSMTSGDLVAGVLGNAISFDGVDDLINLGDNASLSPTTAITIQHWFKTTEASVDGHRAITTNDSYFLGAHSSKIEIVIWDGGSPRLANRNASGGTVISNNTWYMAHGTYNGSSLITYLNGSQDRTGSYTGDIDDGSVDKTIDLGNTQDEQDEVRLLSTALSANWISTEYNNQSSPSTFWTTGAEVDNGGVEAPAIFFGCNV